MMKKKLGKNNNYRFNQCYFYLLPFSFQVLVFILLLLFLRKNASGKCLMYGQCNEILGLFGTTYQNCFTPNAPPKRMSDTKTLISLKELCPDLFGDGDDGNYKQKLIELIQNIILFSINGNLVYLQILCCAVTRIKQKRL